MIARRTRKAIGLPEGEGGFTLMETIVALVLFSSVFIALYNGMSTAWRGVRLAKSDAEAVDLARAKLAAAGVDSPLSDGAEASGEEDGIEWRIDVQQYALPEATQTELAAFWVTVAVSWRGAPAGGARSLVLKTLKITRP